MGKAQEKIEADDFEQTFADELEPGHTLMHGQYTIEAFLNAGGFGITYSAKDSLGRKVVIKECFPGSFCRRSTEAVQARSRAHQRELASIVRLFVQEAHSLARLNHPNIVGVHQVFEENNTAYMALDFINGRDLLEMIENPVDVLEPDEVETILRKILGAIDFIHQQGVLHRDISPDNILLQTDQEPILIDFGAAREQASKQSRVLSALRVVKDGYSPQEFYIEGSEQGPFSDLYALGATFYHLLTGDLPANSQARLAAVASGVADPYEALIDRMPMYSERFLRAIDQSLAILPKDRIASANDWLAILDGEDQSPAKKKKAAAAAAGEAAATSGKGKIALLGGVALIALIAGAVVMTQTDLLGGGADAPAAATEVSAVTPTPIEPVEEDISLATGPVTTETTAVADPLPFDTAPAEPEAVAEVPSFLATVPAEPDAVAEVPSFLEQVTPIEPEPAPAAPSFLAPTTPAPEVVALTPALPSVNPHPDVVDVLTPPVRVTLAPAVTQVNPHPDIVDVLTPPVRVVLAPAVTQVNPHPPVHDYIAALTITPPVESLRPQLRRGPTEDPHPEVVIPVKVAAVETPEPALPIVEDVVTPPEPALPIEEEVVTLPVPALPTAENVVTLPEPAFEFATQAVTVAPAPEVVAAATQEQAPAPTPTPAPVETASGSQDFMSFAFGENSTAFAPAPVETVAAPAPSNTVSAASTVPVVTSPEVYNLPGLQTGWVAQMPYEGIFTAGDGETKLFAVNGVDVSGRVEFDTALRSTTNAPTGAEVVISVLTGPSKAQAVTQNLTLPIVHKTFFLNGLAFEARYNGDTWDTVVTQAPENLGLDLQVGDVLAGDLTSAMQFIERTSLPDLIASTQSNGRPVLSIGVMRDGGLHVVPIPNPTN